MIQTIQYITINSNNYRISNKQNRSCLQNFQGAFNSSNIANIEGKARKAEFCLRKIINKFFDLFKWNQNNELINEFLKVDTKSPEYTDILRQISRQFLGNKNLEVNYENGRLTNIAMDKSPHIFILNHDNQSKDPKMLAAFNTMLYDEYINCGLAKSCPRPKIVLNEDILLTMNEQNRKIFEKMGAVGVDASIYNANKQGNSKKIIRLMKEFANGNINIFIFPEGKLSILKHKPLHEKFQLGIAEVVTALTNKLKEVKVTPLGLAYGKKWQVDSLYIGETITFKKIDDNICASIGNIISPFSTQEFKTFFKNKSETIITSQGIPVKGKEQAQYVGGILCENLRICKEEAKKAITKPI